MCVCVCVCYCTIIIFIGYCLAHWEVSVNYTLITVVLKYIESMFFAACVQMQWVPPLTHCEIQSMTAELLDLPK